MMLYNVFIFLVACTSLIFYAPRIKALERKLHDFWIIILHLMIAVTLIEIGYRAWCFNSSIFEAPILLSAISWIMVSRKIWPDGMPVAFGKETLFKAKFE